MATRFSNGRDFTGDIKSHVYYIRKLFNGNKRQLFALIFLIVFGIIVGNITPYIFGLLIDNIVAVNSKKIKEYILLFFAFNLSSIIVELIESLLGNDISIKTSNRIKKSILEKILYLKVKEQDTYTTGEWMNRLEGDADNIVGYYLDLLSSCTMIVINIMVSIIFLIKLSPLLTVIAVIFLPFGYLINYLFKDRVKILKKELKNTEDENFSLINCVLCNLRNIKVWQLEPGFIEKYEHLKQKRIKAQKNSLNLSLLIKLFQKTNNIIFEIIVLVVSSILIVSGNLSIGGMVSFNSYLEKLFNAISKCLELNIDKHSVKISIERINEIDNKEIESFSNTNELIDIKKLEFADVSFGYNSKKVLSDVNLCIDKPGIYTFVGKNGAGKTTILKLTDKLYDIESGNIKLNDENIEKFSVDTLRNSITFMMKETLIIPGTLWDNLTIGAKESVDKKEVDDICKKVRLTPLVRKIGGYYCEVRENSLSSGEKQKIGLVRVLLRKSSLVMLDEVTSDLDGSIEEKVLSILEEMATKKIILNVCHRKKLMESSTKIFVLDEKEGLIESGTHDELKEKNGRYCELL